MKKERVKQERDFNFKYHLIGRIWMLLAIILFLMVPVIICVYYKTLPNWAVFTGSGAMAVWIPLIINFLSGVAEPIIYAPMLGTNGEYLAFITGNLSNLKIPCVVKAQEIAGTKLGTEENEVVSTLAIATSTLVTVVVIAILVLCLGVSNLQSIIEENQWITPAFTCVVYALFGSLGGKYVAKNTKLALIPAAVIVALSIGLGFAKVNPGSAYLFVGIGLCAIFAVLQFFRERKKQKSKEELERLQQIAEGNPKIETDENNAESTADENAVTDENASENVVEEATEIAEDTTQEEQTETVEPDRQDTTDNE